ncbi:MAG: AlpA family phage regulatory protein [Pseudomonadota bacterium]|nr:AlpA family phage regulatory protein [Pseudomonadota bacterium]
MTNKPYIVDRYEVERLTSLHKSSIYRLMKEGKFPKPLRLSTMRVAWRLADIEAWVNSLETTDEHILEA